MIPVYGRCLPRKGHGLDPSRIWMNKDVPSCTLMPSHTFSLEIMERVKQLAAHLVSSPSGVTSLEVKRPEDVVITLAIRSPLCKAKKGGFKDAK